MAQKQYLDDNGNPVSTGKMYLDDNGNPAPNPANLTPEMRGNLVRNASPTQFEIERRTGFQPGFGGRVADVARGFVNNAKDQMYKMPLEQVNQHINAPVDVQTIKHDADVGDVGGIIGDVFPQTAMAAGALASPVIGKGVDRTASFLRAPSDPNALYSSYLRPVASAPHSVPQAPEPVMRGVLRDMEAAGEGAAAERISSGRATIGDLDQMRQRANRLSRSIYRSPGNYPPGLAEGADNFASSLRDEIYPVIEKSQGLESGSLRGVKRLQGRLMESERNPSFFRRLGTQAGGAVPGSMIGYKIGGPNGAMLGGIIGSQLAEPVVGSMERGIIGLRTKALASSLPEPGLVPRASLPFPRTMPESSIPITPTQPPPIDATTRAQRLGLLLSEPKNSIQLPSSVEPLPDNPTQPPQRTVFREPKTGKMKRGYTSGGKKMTGVNQ